MTKDQFITALRHELRKLPPEEVVAATEYYEEYFNEVTENAAEYIDPAGGTIAAAAEIQAHKDRQAEAEARLIAELGSPKAVAAQIKSEYASRVLAGDESTQKYKQTVGTKISAVWWVILGIFAVPVGIPVAIALGSVVFALLIALFAVIISLYAAAAGIAAGGLASLFMGVASIGASFATVIMSLGTGLALIALAVLMGIGLTVICKKLVQVPVNLAHRNKERRG